jgi:PAS domain S-box-containing protein
MNADLSSRLLEEFPDAVIAVAPTGEIVYWSPAATTMFGYESAEVVGRPIAETLVPGDRERDERDILRDALASGSITYEASRRCKDGSLLYVDVTGKVVRDAAGCAQYVLFSKKDVTQLKVQRDARLVEARFGDLLQSTPDGIVIASPSGRIVLANPQLEALFGYERGELHGQLIEVLLPERYRGAHIGHRSKFFSQPRARSMGAGLELHGLRRDGTEFPVEISLSPLETDAGRLVMSAVRDISDRKKAEQKFRGLLESAPDAIVIVDGSGQIVLVNSQAVNLFGYRREELLGKPIEMLVPSRLHARHVHHRTHFFSDPNVRPMGAGADLYGQRKNGSEFPVEISLSPLETEEGTLVSSAIRDITDRKRFEQTLQEKNVELEQASQAKDRFLATMSHELRTPLNAIIGFTGTLLMRLPGPLTPDQEKQLRTVQTSAKHLLALINDLLDLAKVEAGKVDLNLQPTSCQSVLEEVVSALQLQAEAKGLDLTTTLPREPVIVRTDRRALSQIVLNLANNAIKFTERGSVHLSLGFEEGGTVAIRVTDTGIGIRPDDQAALFEAFSQLDSGARRREGTGLGLHLSRKLADLLGGRIVFQSEHGKGSAFVLLLPAKADACRRES